jgi:hypothetical protein
MTNPANERKKINLPPGYQPLGSGVQKLAVPEKDGFHRRWFRGNAGRIAQAQRAGYQFVDPSEVELNNFDLGGDAKDSGNTDLGSRVSIVSGEGVDASGQAERLYLMECPIELYEYSQSILAEKNESVAAALRGGNLGVDQSGETAHDSKNRYLKGKTPDLFIPKRNT